MDLVQLRYFVRVAELGSFSKAAAELHIAQPAVTRQIRLLEEELGVKLLLRHSRGAEPTEAGSTLRDSASMVLRSVEAIRRDITERKTQTSGLIRLGFPPSIGMLLVGGLVQTYTKNFPKVRLHLMENFSHILREWLLTDRLDIAMTTSMEANPLLESIPLFQEQLWLLGPNTAPPPPDGKYYIEQLANFPLIQTSGANSLRVILERAAAERNLKLNVVLEIEAHPIIKDLVRRGVGYHVAPYSAVMDDVKNGLISGAPLDGFMLRRVLQRRVDRPMLRAVEEMVQLIKQQVQAGIESHSPVICPLPSDSY